MLATRKIREIDSKVLILLAATFIVAFTNQTFFANVLSNFPLHDGNLPHLISLAIVLIALFTVTLSLCCFKRTTKPILIFVLLVSSVTAYFMDSHGVIINDEMLRNAMQTNAAETFDLLTASMLFYFLAFGLLPALFVWKVPLRQTGWRQELRSRALLITVLLAVVAACTIPYSRFYASFLRGHKILRSYVNPGYALYSLFKYSNETAGAQENAALTPVGEDARIPPTDMGRELVIMVVGEAARADRFSINGYARKTTPTLEAEKVISFTNFWSCGTSTAVSVPCMFSPAGMENFNLKKFGTQENLLDILRHADVNVLWLDNNSDSKGVALRSAYKNYRSRDNNPVCDEECRDEGMLANLQEYIDSHPKGDIFIALHQMGNHGPAYFKRYPPAFEKYVPACKNNDLSRCTREEIGNAYDNAILYTDYFLGKVIQFLKKNDPRFETALFYVSDHGESLGENGLYLHGLPRTIAPEAQTHIPAVMWFGSNYHDVDQSELRRKTAKHFSHDNVLHTVLGLMEIKTKAYRPELDILEGSRHPE